jgi:hypothetical protein
VIPARRLAIAASTAAVIACSRGGAPVAPDAATAAQSISSTEASPTSAPSSTSSPTPTASPTPEDAGNAAPPAVPLTATVVVVAGQELPIPRDGTALVDPAAAFRVEVGAHLTDGRLALHDEQDAMVASSGTTEVGPSWTRYRLVPDEPLRSGTAYVLRVDGTEAREAHDPAGRAYAPVTLKLKTTGERPAAPVKKKRGKRRR